MNINNNQYNNQKIRNNLNEDLELARYFNNQNDNNNSKNYYISYLNKEYDKNKGAEILKEIFKIIVKSNLDPDFLINYYKKFQVDETELLEYKTERNKRIQFMNNKRKFTIEDTCSICLDNTKLIIYDCIGHYFCENCYNNLPKCPLCKIEKHQIMNIDISDNDSCITYIE